MTVDRSLLSISDFRIIFGPTNQLRSLDVYATSVNLPSISMDGIPTPYRQFAGFTWGGKINYDQLNIRFACDEKMNIYEDLFNWMKNNSTIPALPGGNPYDVLNTADITLKILTSHLNPNRDVRFIRAFPTSIAPMEFNIRTAEQTYANFDVTFHYDYFEFLSPGNGVGDACE